MSSLPSVILPDTLKLEGLSSVFSTLIVSVIVFFVMLVFSVPIFILRSVVAVSWSCGSMIVDSVQRSSGVVIVILIVPCFGVGVEMCMTVENCVGLIKVL